MGSSLADREANFVRLVAALTLALLPGCISRQGHPLYVASAPLPAERIAILAGYVERVDGQDVSSLGGTFDLLPGCHLVETPARWSKGGTNGALVAVTGRITFALPMRAGHSYVIEVETEMPTGPTGTLTVSAREMNANGEPVRTFARAATPADVGACQRCANEPGAC